MTVSDIGTRRERKPTLAMVSTYDELCGIAGYTRAVERQLSDSFEVEVQDLDQYLLRHPHKRIQKMADRHIEAIAERIRGFDAVNIQLEHGTLGQTPKQIVRRLTKLCEAAKNLSVTFHTVTQHDGPPWAAIWQAGKKGNLFAAVGRVHAWRRDARLSMGVYGLLRRMQRQKRVHAIVHAKRDMRLLKDVYGLSNVLHHPLAYVEGERAERIRAAASRDAYPLLADIDPGAVLVGTFGFLSPYKGFETAVAALDYLPPNHHLLIFGGVHPQTIKKGLSIDGYVASLLDRANVGNTVFDTLGQPKKGKSARSGAFNISVTSDSADLLTKHPKDLGNRVHFMGVLSDAEFESAMAICDVVVLPYLEVGQSGSGPISIALDMGCRVVASRTKTFLQFAKYHPGRVEFFDIGNFLELAARIKAQAPDISGLPPRAYTAETNAALYRAANPSAPAIVQEQNL